jgi:hypothetical protein
MEKILRIEETNFKTKSKSWIWWHKNSIVSRFEMLKSQKDFDKEIQKSIQESLLFKLIAKLDRWLSYHFC